MRPLVISGGPAVGKSTCGRRLAEERERGAFIDAEFDLLHRLVATPPDVDVVLDVAGSTVDEQTDAIRRVWTVS